MSRNKEGGLTLNNRGLYKSFEELRAAEVEGEDYDIVLCDRGTSCAVFAPHGGFNEPGTSEIAALIAGETHSFYTFRSLKEERGHELHITSHRFDEPRALQLASTSEFILTVHGYPSDEEFILIGGKYTDLSLTITQALLQEDFPVIEDVKGFDNRVRGVHSNNICNRGSSEKGVQIEISSGLITRLLNNDPNGLERFITAVRTSLELHPPEA